jgi:predicted ABC-type ATPase
MNPLSRHLLAWFLDKRPILVAVAGPNGAGKSTFYQSFLQDSGFPFINADVLAARLKLDAYAAASFADSIRWEMVGQRQSFVFETIFSDSSGEKLKFLKQAAENGYTVVLFFIGISGPEISEERVAMRVAQGGPDVPTDKSFQRYPRTLVNLKAAVSTLPHVFILDNSDLRSPYRLAARFENGKAQIIQKPILNWLKAILPNEDGECS